MIRITRQPPPVVSGKPGFIFTKNLSQKDSAGNPVHVVWGIPEHKVDLPPIGGRPSQNDLFVIAKSNNELISISVEGKVAETFGPLVSEWQADATPGKRERLAFLVELLGLGERDISKIRYQLLHRTASALLEAERFCAPHALMLVHSFSQEHRGFEDYVAFAGLYGQKAEVDTLVYVGEVFGKDLYLGWVVGEGDTGFRCAAPE